MLNEAAVRQTRARDRLRNTELPVLHPGVPKLIRSLSDTDLSLHQVATIVERFPSVAMRLLALANSVWSAPASPVRSLPMACSRLGLNVVRSVSIALTVASPFDPRRCPGFDAERYWTSAMLTADAAYALATLFPVDADRDPQSVRTAGLLHNIGLVWMASHMASELASVFQEKQAQPDSSLSQLLRDATGLDYAMAGAWLGEAWRLPGSIVQPMQHLHNEDYAGEEWQTARLVRYARTLVSVLLDGAGGERQAAKLASVNSGEIGAQAPRLLDEIRMRVATTQDLVRELFAVR